MPVQINLVFLTAGFLQSLVLSFAIWKNRRSNASTLLIAFILVLTLMIFMKGLSKTWLLENIPAFFVVVAYELPLLFGPLAFLYVKKSLDENSNFTIRDWLLFVPFLTISVLLAFFFVKPMPWMEALLPNNNPRLLLYAFFEMTLLGFCFHKARKLIQAAEFEKNKKGEGSEQVLWLSRFIKSVVILGVVFILALKALYLLYPSYQEIRFIFLGAVAFIYWLSYQVLGYNEMPAGPLVIPFRNLIPSRKYAHSGLTRELADEVERKLKGLMDVAQPWLKAGLTIDDLARGIDVHRHHLSQVLNERFHKTFNEFVNEYRVEKAMSLLLDPKYDYLTIAGIAFECGFNSVSAFNIVFRKQTGRSPSSYKKSRLGSSRPS